MFGRNGLVFAAVRVVFRDNKRVRLEVRENMFVYFVIKEYL